MLIGLLQKSNFAKDMERTALLIRFGERIRQLRIERGLSQEELAELASVHRTYIGMIERAEKNVTLSNIYKLSKALGVDIADLFEKDNGEF